MRKISHEDIPKVFITAYNHGQAEYFSKGMDFFAILYARKKQRVYRKL